MTISGCLAWPAAALLGLSGMPAFAQDNANPAALEARLTQVEGTVYVHLHDQPEGTFIDGQIDQSLEEGDVVRTGDDGRAEVAFEGPSVIDLAPNTDFAVKSLAPQDTEFDLGLGSLIAKIKKLAEGQQLRFATPTAVAAVRGTELGVSQDADDAPAHVGVYDEGHVAVSQSGRQDAEVSIGPGEETEVGRGQAPAQPHPLQALAAYRARLQAVRGRQDFWRANWRARSLAQRRIQRQALLRRRFIQAGELRRMRAEQRHPFRSLEQRRRNWRQLRRTQLRQDSGQRPALADRAPLRPRPALRRQPRPLRQQKRERLRQ